MTFADLAFLPWHARLGELLPETGEEVMAPWPNVAAWHARMAGRASWRKCMLARDRLMEEQGLDSKGMPKSVESVDPNAEPKFWVHLFTDLVKDGE